MFPLRFSWRMGELALQDHSHEEVSRLLVERGCERDWRAKGTLYGAEIAAFCVSYCIVI